MALYTVLYVDDEPDLLDLAKIFLEKLGNIAIDTRESASEGLAALRKKPYDAIISDYQMPDMDGIDFLKTVRREFDDLPFILFTGRGREDVVIEAINNGVDFYLQKGGDVKAQFAELYHKIHRAVESKRAMDARRDSEKRLTTLFHASPIHQMLTEYTSGRILDINNRFLNDLRLDRAEVIGKTLQEIGLVVDPQQYFVIRQQLEREGTVRNAELFVRASSGKTYTTLISMTRVQVPGQDLIYTQSMDITARKNAHNTIDALLNAPPDVSMLLDTEGIILAVNEAASTRFKVPADDLVGKNAYFLISPELASMRQKKIKEAARTKSPLVFMDNRTGKTYENHIYPVLGPDGGVAALAVYSRDVTDEKLAREALKESEEKYRLLVENSQDTIYIYRKNRILFINRKGEDLTGYSREELLGKDLWDFIHPEDRARLQASAARRISGEQVSHSFTARIVQKNGEVRDAEFFVDLVDFQGQSAIFGIARDITEKKRADEAIREREEQLRSLADNLPLGMVYQVIREPDGTRRFVHVSAGIVVVNEISPDAVLQDPMMLYRQIVKEDLPRVKEAEEHAHMTMSLFSVETRIRTPSGTERWVLLRSAPRQLPDGRTLWDGIELDITATKRADEELKAAYEQLTASQEELQTQLDVLRDSQEQITESERQYRSILDNLQDAYIRVDPEGRLIMASPSAARMYGYDSVNEMMGMPVNIMYRSHDVRDEIFALLKRNGKVVDYTKESLRRDGTSFWASLNIQYYRAENGQILGAEGIIRDISDRKQAEEALRTSEENYRLIIENMQDVFYRVNREGIITMISSYGARLVGYVSPADIIGKMRADDFYADPAERETFLKHLFETKVVTGYPLSLVDRQRNLHYATASCRLLFDNTGNIEGIEGVLHDVTHLKDVENALRQANRQITLMTSITRHDIHNQLMALGGWLELSRASISDPDAMLELITKEQKIADVISQQISFTKIIDDMGVKAPLWQDPVYLIEKSKLSLPFGNIRLEYELSGIEFFADLLFEKVFYNLFDNALRYGGEKMTMIRILTKPAKDHMLLIIEDDGVGIPSRNKTKLFDRGFGKNTGLGLFLVREILAITGMTIRELGKPGKGARFEIRVPRTAFRYRDVVPLQEPGTPSL